MKHFSFQEFERSDIAYRHGLDNRIPTEAIKNNICSLTDNVLDPLREAWGQPITVTSGYRSARVNALAGGVGTSSHLAGHAADITAGSAEANRKLYDLAQALRLPYFELIGKKYGFRWLHISHNPKRQKRNPS